MPTTAARTRPSIHGDVIHSRPLPVNYGTGRRYGVLRNQRRHASRRGRSKRPGALGLSWRPSTLQVPAPARRHAVPLTSRTCSRPESDAQGLLLRRFNRSLPERWTTPRCGSFRRCGAAAGCCTVRRDQPGGAPLKWRVGCPNLTNDTGCTPTSSRSARPGRCRASPFSRASPPPRPWWSSAAATTAARTPTAPRRLHRPQGQFGLHPQCGHRRS